MNEIERRLLHFRYRTFKSGWIGRDIGNLVHLWPRREEDPEAILGKVRTVIEKICKQLCQHAKLDVQANKPTLNDYVQALERNGSPIKDNNELLIALKTLRDYGNFGAHSNERIPTKQSTEQCMELLHHVLEWVDRMGHLADTQRALTAPSSESSPIIEASILPEQDLLGLTPDPETSAAEASAFQRPSSSPPPWPVFLGGLLLGCALGAGGLLLLGAGGVLTLQAPAGEAIAAAPETASETSSAPETSSASETPTAPVAPDAPPEPPIPTDADPPSPLARLRAAGGVILVPAGPFTRGSNDGDPDERPVKRVEMSAFEIDRFEVTVAAYRICVEADACTPPRGRGDLYNWSVAGRERHPINGVSWDQARAHCRWLGGDLPTEVQWEKAARGDDGRDLPWGRAPATCERVKMKGCGPERTDPVGAHPEGASPYGVHDMAGNVFEWTADTYAELTYRWTPDPADPRDPAWRVDTADLMRVYRGGSYGRPAEDQRVWRREGMNRRRHEPSIGFRCAYVPE